MKKSWFPTNSFQICLLLFLTFFGYSSACNGNVKLPPPGVLPNGTDNKCASISFDHDSFVCVCNSSHCDGLPAVETLEDDHYVVVMSDKESRRFAKRVVKGSKAQHPIDLQLVIDGHTVFQTIDGFGGAFTDAAGHNIASLSMKTQERLLRSYFGPESAEFSVGRIPMAGTDFSTRRYSYADLDGDHDLEHFSLADEDLTLKIPYIQLANELSTRKIKYFGSPWSAPPWMKTNNDWKGYGQLKGDSTGPFYKTWAKYFIRFLEEYEKHNVTLWGLTAQNEPEDGYIPFFPFNCMGFTAKQTRDFVVNNLGPLLKASKYKDVKLMTLDDNRFRIWSWVNTLFDNGKDTEAMKYVDGTAVHWYWNSIKPASIFTDVHNKYPDKFIFATEACEGWEPLKHKVNLGDWSRAEDYAHSIIEDLQNWVTGWTDWNLALNLLGGPNWAENFVDAAIIVDAKKDIFYKQPMYYALAHFSKYIPPGSKVIKVTPGDKSWVESVAVDTPEGHRVLVIHNRDNKAKNIRVLDADFQGGFIYIRATPKSIITVTWKI